MQLLNSHKSQTRQVLTSPFIDEATEGLPKESHDQSVPDSGLEPSLRSQSPSGPPSLHTTPSSLPSISVEE